MKCKKILVIMLILIFITVFSICVYLLLKDLQELNESNESTEDLIEESVEINEETQEKKIDWDYLKSVNEDIVAWIEIEDIEIFATRICQDLVAIVVPNLFYFCLKQMGVLF